MTAILSVRGLSARIAGQQVVEDATFEVAEHGVTALLGRNGVGKSSTIKALLGLYERSGEVTFDGAADYVAWKVERHSGVQLQLSDWQRRHPLLAAPGIYLQLRRRGVLR